MTDARAARNTRTGTTTDGRQPAEQCFIQLADGRWLLIYTHFEGGAGDHASAYLAGRISSDNGLTWTHEDSLVLPNQRRMDIISVSLLRLQDQRTAPFYLRKDSLTAVSACASPQMNRQHGPHLST